MGQNTAHLFMYAIEKSGSGPPYDVMNLGEDQGVAAFLRAVKYQISVDVPFSEYKTIFQYAKENNVPDNIGESPETGHHSSMDNDNGIDICKAGFSFMVVFLHVDQGCFENCGYTPFASPVCNSRSIHQQHVDKVCREIKDGNSVVAQEDFAIVPYEVSLVNEDMDAVNEQNLITYQCTLNRDKQTPVKIQGKNGKSMSKFLFIEWYRTVRC
jgi:hypothetical protein